jgi:hypothetical protein
MHIDDVKKIWKKVTRPPERQGKHPNAENEIVRIAFGIGYPPVLAGSILYESLKPRG